MWSGWAVERVLGTDQALRDAETQRQRNPNPGQKSGISTLADGSQGSTDAFRAAFRISRWACLRSLQLSCDAIKRWR